MVNVRAVRTAVTLRSERGLRCVEKNSIDMSDHLLPVPGARVTCFLDLMSLAARGHLNEHHPSATLLDPPHGSRNDADDAVALLIGGRSSPSPDGLILCLGWPSIARKNEWSKPIGAHVECRRQRPSEIDDVFQEISRREIRMAERVPRWPPAPEPCFPLLGGAGAHLGEGVLYLVGLGLVRCHVEHKIRRKVHHDQAVVARVLRKMREDRHRRRSHEREHYDRMSRPRTLPHQRVNPSLGP